MSSVEAEKEKLASEKKAKQDEYDKLMANGDKALKSEDLLKGFDPKTARALVQFKTKYPQADNVLSALLADVEKNERDGDKADYKQEKELARLTKAIEVLQKEIQVLKSQKGK